MTISDTLDSAPFDVEVGDATSEAEDPPLTPSVGLVLQLNDRWRVATDELQWMLQQRGLKKDVFISRSWCRTREGLLQCVKEHCGEIDPVAQATLKALPDYFIEPLRSAR
jgi:hypothetical protein